MEAKGTLVAGLVDLLWWVNGTVGGELALLVSSGGGPLSRVDQSSHCPADTVAGLWSAAAGFHASLPVSIGPRLKA